MIAEGVKNSQLQPKWRELLAHPNVSADASILACTCEALNRQRRHQTVLARSGVWGADLFGPYGSEPPATAASREVAIRMRFDWGSLCVCLREILGAHSTAGWLKLTSVVDQH